MQLQVAEEHAVVKVTNLGGVSPSLLVPESAEQREISRWQLLPAAARLTYSPNHGPYALLYGRRVSHADFEKHNYSRFFAHPECVWCMLLHVLVVTPPVG
jgi:hypothetical protein